ncbi:hypothetical protein JYT98_00765 [bacterium AH-315-K05]|nr:hypothetical protein [bacterium AH-315-K05]
MDESNVKYIIKRFKEYWRERLRTYRITLDNKLTLWCFKYFNRQFMQIKSTSNILFYTTHIS